MSKRGPTPKRKPWQPLTQRIVGGEEHFRKHGLTVPDRVYANELYSVFVRVVPSTYEERELSDDEAMLHVSFHRHDRAAVRDWRHFQAIKNEVAGSERTAIEIFPAESQLVDTSNEYHLWVLPVGYPLPFAMPEGRVMTQAEGVAEYGVTKARQRDWQPGIPTGKGVAS